MNGGSVRGPAQHDLVVEPRQVREPPEQRDRRDGVDHHPCAHRQRARGELVDPRVEAPDHLPGEPIRDLPHELQLLVLRGPEQPPADVPVEARLLGALPAPRGVLEPLALVEEGVGHHVLHRLAAALGRAPDLLDDAADDLDDGALAIGLLHGAPVGC
jgi:hypothetical protein